MLVKKIFNRISKFIFSAQHDILSSALTLALMFAISRFFGILRYRTFATYFTRGEIDIFLVSFRVPDFIFEIVITGALSSAFIPIYIKYNSSSEKLTKAISSLVNCIMIILIFFSFFFVIFTPQLLSILTPGYTKDPLVFDQIVKFSRLLILTQLPMLVTGSLLSGIAQANKIFIATTLSPLAYNLGIILGTVFLAPKFGINGPIYGVIVGAFFYLFLQIPILFKTEFKYSFFMLKKKYVVEFFRLFFPRLFTVLSSEIDVTIDLMLSSLLQNGSYTIFIFAQNLHLVPVSLVGIAFGQASLPYLTEMFKQNKFEEAKRLVTTSLLQLLFLAIPMSVILIFAQTPIVRIVFGGKKFDWLGTNYTADTLMFFALAIPFHTIFYFLVRTFYAMHDTRTPLKISFFGVLINSVVSSIAVLYLKLPIWSLSLSFSLAITINVLLLLYFLYKKLGVALEEKYSWRHLLTQTTKIYVIAYACAPLPYGLMKLLDPLILDTSKTLNVLILLFISVGAYGSLYMLISWGAGLEEIYFVGGIITKVKTMSKKVTELFIDLG